MRSETAVVISDVMSKMKKKEEGEDQVPKWRREKKMEGKKQTRPSETARQSRGLRQRSVWLCFTGRDAIIT